MRFIDEATVVVKGGHGGPGAVAFRRETMEPRGGPAGGNGGKGGSIYLVPDRNLATLMDLRVKRKYQGEGGHKGEGARRNGSDGQDVIIRCPIGTIIKDLATNEVLVEILEKDSVEPILICKGGRGGMGNAHFATSTHQTPRFAQPGEPGEEKELHFELKVLADVGLLGFPNAGKSSLIAAISAARPKIADYPFTTLVPNLGVVRVDADHTFVVADVPGLIEGASQGTGLGIQFLKHLERTKLLLHILDVADGQDFERHYQILRKELGLFNPQMLERYEVVVFNKLDALQDEEQKAKLLEFKNSLRSQGRDVFEISVATRQGIKELVDHVSELIFSTAKAKRAVKPELPDAAYIT